jgi:hypothetical protein
VYNKYRSSHQDVVKSMTRISQKVLSYTAQSKPSISPHER